MSVVLWLVAGVLVGVGAEHLVSRRGAPSSDRAPSPTDRSAPGAPPGLRRGGAAPPRRRRRRAPWILALVALVLVGIPLALWLWANALFGRIDRVAVEPALRHSGAGTNYLLVGTDSRPGVSGNRADTIVVLRIEGGRGRMLSIPRDLFVEIAGTGRRARINSAYAAGPVNLIRTIDAELGLPVDRYLEVDFGGFGPLIDAIGGVDIDFPHPAFDPASGLDVKTAGRVHLDGTQALAYVRSRQYVEVVDGQERPDRTSDIGRQQRQQAFLRAVLSKASGTRNPWRLAKVATALSDGVRIDDAMSLWDGIRLARDVGDLDPGTEQLPVTPRTLSSGAQVLSLDRPAADAVLDRFR